MSLKLNFQLETAQERLSLVNSILQTYTPTEHERDVIADYLLWSKGLDTDDIYLKSKWDSTTVPESLDELMESPTFDENSIRPQSAPQYRTPRQVFSRSETRRMAPAYLMPDFETLWHQIDTTDYLIEQYELFHHLRTTPIREKLLSHIDPEEAESLTAQAQKISQYTYLRKRHQLIDLRREQYTMRDSYSEPLFTQSYNFYNESEERVFGVNIDVKPFGLREPNALDFKLFPFAALPTPDQFSEDELKHITHRIWDAPTHSDYFDFTNPDHLYKLFNIYDTIQDAADRERVSADSTLPAFWDTLQYYRSIATLTPLLNDILDLKIARKANQTIADTINAKYNKSYGANYISTLFCKKALAAIADAAAYHYEVVQNLFFEENFKVCIDCGKTLLIDSRNFVRKAKSKDGFSPRCKACEKLKRSAALSKIGD